MRNKGASLLEVILTLFLIILFLSFNMSFKAIERFQAQQAFKEFIFYLKAESVNASYRLNDFNDIHSIEIHIKKNYYKIRSGTRRKIIKFPKSVKFLSSNISKITFGLNCYTNGGTIELLVNNEIYTVRVAAITGRVHYFKGRDK